MFSRLGKKKLVIFGLAAALLACGQNPGGSSSPESSEDGAGSGAVRASKQMPSTHLGSAFPVDLALTSIFERTPGTATEPDPDDFGDYRTMVAANWQALNPTTITSCQLEILAPQEPTEPECFGPAIEFQGHPDHGGAVGEMPRGTLGIWNSYAPNLESCAVAETNHQMARIRVVAGTAFASIKMTLCAAMVANLTLPTEIGASTDILSGIEAMVADFLQGGTLDQAVVTKVEDASGNHAYEIDVKTILDDGSELATKLAHVKAAADNSLYQGQISFTWAFGAESPLPVVYAGSIQYDKSDMSLLSTEYRQGRFSATTDVAAAFDNSGILTIPETFESFVWGVANVDPAILSGRFALLSAKDSSKSNVRSMLGSLDATAAENDSGCIFVGHGDGLAAIAADSERNGWLDRFVCHADNSAVAISGYPGVQQQCFSRNQASGILTLTASHTRYIPRTSCGVTDEINDDFTWRYQESAGSFTNFIGPNELVLKSEIDSADLVLPSFPSSP